MTMTTIIDDFISELQPENVPLEYIVLAKYTDRTGVEIILHGDAMAHFLNNPQLYNVVEARVILDVRKLRRVIKSRINQFFLQLSKLSENDFKKE